MFVLSRVLLILLSAAGAAAHQNKAVSQPETDLKVAAASDLSAALDRLALEFERKTGIHLDVSLGSSGNFFAQIQNGAPFDVFLSADKSYPEKLEKAGQGEPGSVVPYARGKLVLWLPNNSALHLSEKNLQEGNLDALTGADVHKIALANPEHAPYGRAAVAALQHYRIYDQIKDKLVLGENISQTAQFAQSGNADVAFIALSTALSEPMKRAGHWLSLPQDSYPAIEQAGVVVKASTRKLQARLFLEFLSSPGGRSILQDFGFEASMR